MNDCLPHLNGEHFQKIPSALFLKLNFERFTDDQLTLMLTAPELRIQLHRVPSSVIQKHWLQRLTSKGCQYFSIEQIQKLDVKQLSASLINTVLYGRIHDFTPQQLFECHQKMDLNLWHGCCQRQLEELKRGYAARLDPAVLKKIEEILAHGSSHNPPPPEEKLDPNKICIQLPLAPSTFQLDTTKEGKLCFCFLLLLQDLLRRKINANKVSEIYLLLISKSKEQKIEGAAEIPSNDVKKMWRLLGLYTHPDKVAAHPKKKELEIVFKYIAGDLSLNDDKEIQWRKK